MTEAQLRAIYGMLREFRPFSRWGLPEPSAVSFGILRDASTQAMFSEDSRARLKIEANPDFNVTLQQAVEAVAHEMVHARQNQLGRLPANPAKHHNAEFRRLARLVCKELGFNVQAF